MQVPDAIEPAVGYRVWQVFEGRLHSFNHHCTWEPGMPLEATCPSGHEEPPVESCTCGSYAAATFNRLLDMGYTKHGGIFSDRDGDILIAGTVSMWGRVIPGQYGWRAQFAYPKKLLVPYSYIRKFDVMALAAEYGVEYKFFNTLRRH